MTWSQAELDALRKAYASGTLRVSYEGRSVEYGSAADLLQRIRTIESEMTDADQPLRKVARLRLGLGRPSATAISLSMVRIRCKRSAAEPYSTERPS